MKDPKQAKKAIKADNGLIEAKRHGIDRSPQWEGVRKDYIDKNPECAVCGAKKDLNVHHIIPFHYVVALGFPSLELREENLITLCESQKGNKEQNHHLLVGHFLDFKSSNLNVEKDAKETYHMMTESEIKENKKYLAEKVNKLKPLDEMNTKEKEDLISLIKEKFPNIKN